MIHDEKINNKLLILFVLDKFEMPINESILLDICSIDNVWIPYLLCKQVINELAESGFILRENSDNSAMMSLTADGRTCLSHFYRDIPVSTRDDVTEFVKLHRMSYRKKQDFFCDYYRNEDGTFTVVLRIYEVTKALVDMKFVVDSRQIAVDIQNNWNNRAPEVYQALREILVEN